MAIKKVSMRNRIFGIRNADCGMRNLKGDIGNNGLLEWWDGGTIKTGISDRENLQSSILNEKALANS